MSIDTTSARMSMVRGHYEHLGIEDAESLFGAQMESITKFAAELTRRGASQLRHDIYINMPVGILSRGVDFDGHALRSAVAGTIGQAVDWDCNEALEWCADILEDVNMHTEAAFLRKRAAEGVTE